jgi:hypothetical protein
MTMVMVGIVEYVLSRQHAHNDGGLPMEAPSVRNCSVDRSTRSHQGANR